MVNANTRRLAQQTQDTLESRDISSVVTVGLGTAGGVISSQIITDRVMSMLGMSVNPQTITEHAVSIGTKTAVALGFGALAANLSGLALVAAAFAGFGALASAGVDLIGLLLNTAPLAGLQEQGSLAANQMASNTARQASSQPASPSTGTSSHSSLFAQAD